MLLLITRDEQLARRLVARADQHGAALRWVLPAEALRAALEGPPARRILLDLALGEEILDLLRELAKGPGRPEIIGFLDHNLGDLPIRAKLAGADRIVPLPQLERELLRLLGASPAGPPRS